MFLSQPIHFLYTHLAKPLFFLIDPETMHTMFWHVGHFLGKFTITRWCTRKLFAYQHHSLTQTIAWIIFTNPVWLAAWFDKDVQLCHIISDVGFWYTEIWSITAHPYEGNPTPRLYRLKKSEGLIVYYGLKNKWAPRAIQKLRSYTQIHIPIVISIAKTNCQRTTDPLIWKEDYLESLDMFIGADAGDIYELNISCPNAFGGENFTSPALLKSLLQEVKNRHIKKPLFIKLPVDIYREDLKKLLDLCIEYWISWVVISNLTKQRDDIIEKEEITDIQWWISGKPLVDKSNELIAKSYLYCQNKLLIIGVWGIFSAEDAYEKIKQGATLVQLITGMIFQWPQLIWQINSWLVTLLQKDWYTHISEAIGSAHKKHLPL